MEAMVKKYQQRFKRVKEEMNRWDDLQSRLLSQFQNASSIIERLQLISDPTKYGDLKSIVGIKEALIAKQMDSLQTLLRSMNTTVDEFHGVVSSLEKIARDGRLLVKGGGSNQPTTKQLQLRVGIKPCLADCIDGLDLLHHMHHSEYLLKLSIVSKLSALLLKPSATDLAALHQILVDQPNIPHEEADSAHKHDFGYGGKALRLDQERRSGTAWTKDEHRFCNKN
ncbi:Ribosome biogenesis protein C1orf109-like [Dillenia turbinata]|uniref:Ribosome biogenesis protein C1orf109-like n=1 Tax=Dillenia turbinata TaxID=194707 RepID=A0AAN8VWU1_9MAGN